MRADALGNVLFGKARGGILSLLYGRPERKFYYREITRSLKGTSPGALQRELGLLSKLGLIHRFSTGQQVFYQANRHHPIFTEMRSLVAKTVGALHMLQSALTKLGETISVAFVYGSFARGQEDDQSDIDLFVIGEATMEQLLEGIAHLEVLLGRPINPTTYSRAEFKKKLLQGNHFVNSVAKGPKVFLIGGEDEFRGLGKIRLAKSRAD